MTTLIESWYYRYSDFKLQLIILAMKVLSHESALMFGLTHCIYFNCIMNKTNEQKEIDNLPLYLCPVCLRKLQFSCSFNIKKRYKKLLKYSSKYGLSDYRNWVRLRIEALKSVTVTLPVHRQASQRHVNSSA